MGELRIVEGASWQEEIGMAATMVSHLDDTPALLFDDVPGCQKGFRVLVNIFGGLARTDVIAAGLVEAKSAGLLPQPTVVRLAGTNVQQGLEILDQARVELIRADGFAQAASQVVAAASDAADAQGVG